MLIIITLMVTKQLFFHRNTYQSMSQNKTYKLFDTQRCWIIFSILLLNFNHKNLFHNVCPCYVRKRVITPDLLEIHFMSFYGRLWFDNKSIKWEEWIDELIFHTDVYEHETTIISIHNLRYNYLTNIWKSSSQCSTE